MFEKNENKLKEGGVVPFKKKTIAMDGFSLPI